MRRISLILILALCAGLLTAPTAAAYSYGPAVVDSVAAAYTEIAASLNKAPADWPAAEAAFAAEQKHVQAEAGGPEAVAAWQAAVAARDGDLALKVYRAVVLANLQRRLDYALKNIETFETAKTLLDFAVSTYDVLSPMVGDAALDSQVRMELDNAEAALGSPGVLGVGQRPANKEAFQAAREKILGLLRPHFGIDFAAIAASAAPAQTDAAGSGNAKAGSGSSSPAASTEPAPAETPPDPDPAEPDGSTGGEGAAVEEPSPAADPNAAAGDDPAEAAAPPAGDTPAAQEPPPAAVPAAGGAIGQESGMGPLGWTLLIAVPLLALAAVLWARSRRKGA